MTQYRIIVTPDAADDMVELRNYIAEVLCVHPILLCHISGLYGKKSLPFQKCQPDTSLWMMNHGTRAAFGNFL